MGARRHAHDQKHFDMYEDCQTRRTIPSRSAPAWKWQGLHTHGRRALVKAKRAGEAKALEGSSRDVSEETPASKVAATNNNNAHGCQAASAWRTKGANARATLSQGAAGGQKKGVLEMQKLRTPRVAGGIQHTRTFPPAEGGHTRRTESVTAMSATSG